MSEQAGTTAEENSNNTSDRLMIPIMLVKVRNNQSIDVMVGDNSQSMMLCSDSNIEVLNENHVLDALGLTQASEEDIKKYFNNDLNEFLNSQFFIDNQKAIAKEQEEGIKIAKVQSDD